MAHADLERTRNYRRGLGKEKSYKISAFCFSEYDRKVVCIPSDFQKLGQKKRIAFAQICFLAAGDKIIAVNGEQMDGLTHREAIAKFKRVKSGTVDLLVRSRTPSPFPRYVSFVAL